MGSGGDLTDRIRRAIRDPVLPGNVLRATNTSLAHRRETVAERPDWEELRDRGARLRDHVLASNTTFQSFSANEHEELGDFPSASYDAAVEGDGSRPVQATRFGGAERPVDRLLKHW